MFSKPTATLPEQATDQVPSVSTSVSQHGERGSSPIASPALAQSIPTQGGDAADSLFRVPLGVAAQETGEQHQGGKGVDSAGGGVGLDSQTLLSSTGAPAGKSALNLNAAPFTPSSTEPEPQPGGSQPHASSGIGLSTPAGITQQTGGGENEQGKGKASIVEIQGNAGGESGGSLNATREDKGAPAGLGGGGGRGGRGRGRASPQGRGTLDSSASSSQRNSNRQSRAQDGRQGQLWGNNTGRRGGEGVRQRVGDGAFSLRDEGRMQYQHFVSEQHHSSQNSSKQERRRRHRAKADSPRRFMKEHFVQAHCRFLVSDLADYSAHVSDPDKFLPWESVAAVEVTLSAEKDERGEGGSRGEVSGGLHEDSGPSAEGRPQRESSSRDGLLSPITCPICLEQKLICPQMSSCGHIFCFPCIVHHLMGPRQDMPMPASSTSGISAQRNQGLSTPSSSSWAARAAQATVAAPAVASPAPQRGFSLPTSSAAPHVPAQQQQQGEAWPELQGARAMQGGRQGNPSKGAWGTPTRPTATPQAAGTEHSLRPQGNSNMQNASSRSDSSRPVDIPSQPGQSSRLGRSAAGTPLGSSPIVSPGQPGTSPLSPLGRPRGVVSAPDAAQQAVGSGPREGHARTDPTPHSVAGPTLQPGVGSSVRREVLVGRCPMCSASLISVELKSCRVELEPALSPGDRGTFVCLTRPKNSLVPHLLNPLPSPAPCPAVHSPISPPPLPSLSFSDSFHCSPFSKLTLTGPKGMGDVTQSGMDELQKAAEKLAQSSDAEDLAALTYVVVAQEQLGQRQQVWEEHRTESFHSLTQVEQHRVTAQRKAAVRSHQEELHRLKAAVALGAAAKGGVSASDTSEGQSSQTLEAGTGEREEGISLTGKGNLEEHQTQEVGSPHGVSHAKQAQDGGATTSQIPQSDQEHSEDEQEYVFYQEVSGRPIFLHPLNVRCLLQQFGAHHNLPPIIHAPVLELEKVAQSESVRKKLRVLAHLPCATTFSLCEVDLGAIVSPKTLALFEGELRQRAARRRHAQQQLASEKLQQQRDDWYAEEAAALAAAAVRRLAQPPPMSEFVPLSVTNSVSVNNPASITQSSSLPPGREGKDNNASAMNATSQRASDPTAMTITSPTPSEVEEQFLLMQLAEAEREAAVASQLGGPQDSSAGLGSSSTAWSPGPAPAPPVSFSNVARLGYAAGVSNAAWGGVGSDGSSSAGGGAAAKGGTRRKKKGVMLFSSANHRENA